MGKKSLICLEVDMPENVTIRSQGKRVLLGIVVAPTQLNLSGAQERAQGIFILLTAGLGTGRCRDDKLKHASHNVTYKSPV